VRWTLLLWTVVACSSYRSVEEENGYRDVRLGSTPTETSGLVLHRDEGTGDTVYERTPDDPMWGPARLGSVTYHFWDDRLWMVRVRTGDSKGLLSVMMRDYGTPPFSTPWQWNGETVRMNFRGTEYDSTATVTIVKIPIEAKREAERPERLAAKRRRGKERAARIKVEAEKRKAAEAPTP